MSKVVGRCRLVAAACRVAVAASRHSSRAFDDSARPVAVGIDVRNDVTGREIDTIDMRRMASIMSLSSSIARFWARVVSSDVAWRSLDTSGGIGRYLARCQAIPHETSAIPREVWVNTSRAVGDTSRGMGRYLTRCQAIPHEVSAILRKTICLSSTVILMLHSRDRRRILGSRCTTDTPVMAPRGGG